MLKKPEWKAGEPFPRELGIWNWATFLIAHGKRGTHHQYLEKMEKTHGKEVVEKVKNLARQRWRANNIGE